MLSYAFNSLVWSVIGFLSGVGFARTMKDGEMRALLHRSASFISRVGVGAWLVIFALVTTSYLAWQQQRADDRQHRANETTRCQSEFNEEFRQVLTSRSKIADQDRASLRQLVVSITLARSPIDTRRALDTWVSETKKADAERKAHPLPTLSEKCP